MPDSVEAPEIATLGVDQALEPVASAPFFGREPLGFDLESILELGADALSALMSFGDAIARAARQSPAELVQLVGPVVAFLALAIGAILLDRRIRRASILLAERWNARDDEQDSPRGRWRTAILEMAGYLAIPGVAWAMAASVARNVGAASVAWAGLADAFGLLVLLRGIVGATRTVLLAGVVHVPEAPARRVERLVVSSARLVLSLVILRSILLALSDRAEASALAGVTIRVSIAFVSLRFLFAHSAVGKLLPEVGAQQYLRLRAGIISGLRYFFALSSFLSVLWALGFERAASTILVRSYAIAALVVAGVLVYRWLERARSVPRDAPIINGLIEQVDGFVRLCIALGFGAAVLAVLGIFGPLVSALDGLGIAVGESRLTVLGVLAAVFVVFVAVLISRLIRVILDQVVHPRLETPVGTAYAVDAATHYFIIALSIGVALAVIGIDLRAVTVFAGALGVGIGFGLQDFAKNIVSGFVLLFGRTVDKGDIVTIAGEYDGVVEEIGGRMVRVRTRDNTDLIIPASVVVGSPVVNWTHASPVVRVRIPVGVSYGADVRAVEEALLEAARRYEPVLSSPGPDVWLIGFGDSSVNFELHVWVSADRIYPAKAHGKLMFHVWDVLAERGIEIPFPQRDLHLRSVSPEVAEAIGKAALKKRSAN
jgi:small-conductance mechanosensitive channel